jgi:hypothetical protein
VTDRLLSAALERIPPQLEASQETTEASETVEERPERAREPQSATAEAQEGARRPWWRGWFGA